MTLTYFQDFTRDDGSQVTVEYSFSGGSGTSYSPMFGADGGDACEVEIVSVMPNTEEYDRLCQRSLELGCDIVLMSAETRDELREIDESKRILRERCALTDAEDERMCEWLRENHADEPDDGPDWEF